MRSIIQPTDISGQIKTEEEKRKVRTRTYSSLLYYDHITDVRDKTAI